MATPISQRFSIPDAERLNTPTEGQEYPLGSEISVVDEASNEERTWIYLLASGTIAANSINFQSISCTATALPATGGQKLVMPVGSNVAVTGGEYAWFVKKGRYTGTADGSGLGVGDSCEWIKNTATLTSNTGVKSVVTIGYATEDIAADATGEVYLYGNTGVDIAV